MTVRRPTSGDDTVSQPLNLDAWRKLLRVADVNERAAAIRWAVPALLTEIERLRAERDDAYGQGRDDEADGAPMRYPTTRRRVPTQAERIADAIADGHHRITEDEQMTDRYGETLDLIAAAVQTATDDTLRGSIRSMIRRVRPESFDLWSPTPARRPTTTEETP